MYHPVFYQTAAYQKQQELSQNASLHRLARKNRSGRVSRHSLSRSVFPRFWSGKLSSFHKFLRKERLTLDTNN